MIKIDGREIAEYIKKEVKENVLKNETKNLVIFYVGENPVIDSYVKLKQKIGLDLGISVFVKRFAENITQEDLEKEIIENVQNFSGAIVQLPLPLHIDKDKIIDLIPPEKDVDVLSKQSIKLFKSGVLKKKPTVANAVFEIMRFYNLDIKNKKVLVVGRGLLVGQPVSDWLNTIGVPHDVIDKDTENKEEYIKNADVIISGVGIPGFINKDMIKKDVILIDAGTSTSSGKILGDINPDCYPVSSFYTPVPGGVGPITVISLFKNLFLD